MPRNLMTRKRNLMTRKRRLIQRGWGDTGDIFISPPSNFDSSDEDDELFDTAEDGMDECAICLKPLRYYSQGKEKPNGSLYTTICNHEFHFECARKALAINPRCPLCRTNIDDFKEPVIVLYDSRNHRRRLLGEEYRRIQQSERDYASSLQDGMHHI
tara:strand:- start:888 stop:1358 length:471 start_codon:yes stop_codon:yes gene_type:complete